MKVKQSSVVDRVYKWWYMEKYNEFPSKHVNLCPYLRAVLVWAPLRFLFLSKFPWLRVPMFGATLGAIESVGWATSIYVISVETSPSILGFLCLLWFLAHLVLVIAFVMVAQEKFELIDRVSKSAPVEFLGNIIELTSEKAHAAHESICPMIEREERLP